MFTNLLQVNSFLCHKEILSNNVHESFQRLQPIKTMVSWVFTFNKFLLTKSNFKIFTNWISVQKRLSRNILLGGFLWVYSEFIGKDQCEVWFNSVISMETLLHGCSSVAFALHLRNTVFEDYCLWVTFLSKLLLLVTQSLQPYYDTDLDTSDSDSHNVSIGNLLIIFW